MRKQTVKEIIGEHHRYIDSLTARIRKRHNPKGDKNGGDTQ